MGPARWPSRGPGGDGVSASRWSANLAAILTLAVIYFVAAKLGLKLAFVNPSATAVWPPTGIALAALLIFGFRLWPGVLLGAFLANLTTAGTVATSLGIALGNTLEAVTGARLVRRFAGGRDAFDRPYDILKFVLLAGGLSTTVSATLGVASLCAGGFAAWADFRSIWFTWWLGDVGGNLVVAPLVLVWGANPRLQWSRGQIFEALLLLVSLSAAGLLLFGGLVPAVTGQPLTFACLPLLLWPAFRFGQRETITASFILSGIAVWGTLHGYGPFRGGTPNESLLLLQGFLALSAITAMSVAAVVRERQGVQVALTRQATELTRQASELTRSNAELEQFAYVASHDLQQPLRTVTSFLQLLARRYQGRLDPDADDFIRYAVEGSLRMRELIQGLLALSRLGRAQAPIALTSCRAVVEKALANLSVAVRETGAAVTWGELPEVLADELQLVELFENLIGNAIKFRGERRPEVRIVAGRQGDEWLFSVHDNGIGIEPRHWERIFALFQRLHGSDEYPGAGIGLAICSKIVARHGGRIWLDSEPGKGSAFHFSLPVQPKA